MCYIAYNGMENIKRTLGLILANVEQATLNEPGNPSLMLQDLNMAALLAEQLGREITAKEMQVEARLNGPVALGGDALRGGFTIPQAPHKAGQ